MPTRQVASSANPVARPVHTRLRLWPEWLTLSLYTSIVAYAVPFHEPWADEAQAWQMARALSLHDLFFHALRYEGTPGLWHLLLRALVRLHVSYTGMHWVSALIAVSGASVLIFLAPFPRWVRLTLPFTVFLAFQYAIVARSYVLVPLLTFAAAALWKKNSMLLAGVLGLLANTALHGFALAAGLAFVYCVETRRGLHRPKHPRWSLLILAIFFAFAVFTALPPPPDLTFLSETLHKPLAVRLAAAPFESFKFLAKATVPSRWLSVPFALAAIWLITRAVGVLYLVPLLSVAVLSGLSYFNYWHIGFVPIAVIAVAWIATPVWTKRVRWIGRAFIAAWLALQISCSAFTFQWDHAHQYSPDKAAAAYLTGFVHDHQPLAITVADTSPVGAFYSVGLGPYFDRPIFLNQHQLYWLWSAKANTDAQFESALFQRPAAIVAVYTDDDPQFDRSRALASPRLQPLYLQGYGVTQVFCGRKPEGFSAREEVCEIVLEW